MKKLIIHSNEASVKVVSGIVATWSSLADLIEQRVKLPKGCDLMWELSLQCFPRLGHWEAYSMVKMVFEARLESVRDDENRSVDVPITKVEEIMIYDDGTFCWHSKVMKPEDSPETIDRLAKAVSTGQLPGNYHYEANFIPRLTSSESEV